MTVRRSVGDVDMYPGGPRALARELGLIHHGGTMSYVEVEDAAVEAFSANRGSPRVVVTATMPILGARGRRSRPPALAPSLSKAPALDPPQKGADEL